MANESSSNVPAITRPTKIPKLKLPPGNPFKVLKQSGNARCGILSINSNLQKGSKYVIKTPNLMATTSRGIVHHLTPENLEKCSNVSGYYLGAEDFLEQYPNSSPFLSYPDKFRKLFPFPENKPLVTSLRRSQPVESPHSNTKKTMSVMTSQGFKKIPLPTYIELARALGTEILFTPIDLPNLSPGGKPGGNRVRKMIERAIEWLETSMETIKDDQDTYIPYLFAPVLPKIDIEKQEIYLDYLKYAVKEGIVSGLTFWDLNGVTRKRQSVLANECTNNETKDNSNDIDEEITFGEITSNSVLDSLVRYQASPVETPQDILLQIQKGIDVFTNDFTNSFTDAGVSFDFIFPVLDSTSDSLGHNMWDPKYKTDMTLLGVNTPEGITERTKPYTKAYVHHLLDAKEMTGWVLLQMHNFQVSENFMRGIQSTIENGTFDLESERFFQKYGSVEKALSLRDLYKNRARLPRARGYQVKYKELESGQKINSSPYRKL